MAGRPSGESLDPDLPGPVAQEVVELDPRGRVLLSPRIIAEISWLAKGEVLSLAVLDRPKVVRLLSFDRHGTSVLARRRFLISVVETRPGALEALARLEDRYHRVRIPQDRRVTLSNLLLAHLGIQAGAALLYVERLLDEIHIISPEGRSQMIALADEQLADLP
jgi:hypothetical protein